MKGWPRVALSPLLCALLLIPKAMTPSFLSRIALVAALLLLASGAAAQTCTSGDDIVTAGPNSNRGFSDNQENGQSFTAPCDGVLKSITINLSTLTTTLTGTLRVYEGEGTGGTVLVEAPFSFEESGSQTTPFADLPIASGEVYTFFFDLASGTGTLFYDGSNGYAGGQYYFGSEPETAGPFGADDLQFTADVEPAPSGGTDIDIAVNSFTNDPMRGASVFFRGPVTNSGGATEFVYVYAEIDTPGLGTFKRNIGGKDLDPGETFKYKDFPKSKNFFPLPKNAPEGTYTVRVYAASDNQGSVVYDQDSFQFTLGPPPPSAGDYSSVPVPVASRLEVAEPHAAPNPFRDQTEIWYALSETAEVDLRVYDVTGREVASLVSGTQSEGVHEAAFAAGDLPGGVYVWRLAIGGEITTGRVTLAR